MLLDGNLMKLTVFQVVVKLQVEHDFTFELLKTSDNGVICKLIF